MGTVFVVLMEGDWKVWSQPVFQ